MGWRWERGIWRRFPPQLYLLQAVPAAAYRECGETPGPHAGQPLPAGAGAAGAGRTACPLLRVHLCTGLAGHWWQ